MDENEKNRLKSLIFIAIISVFVIVGTVVLLSMCSSRDVSPNITVEGIQSGIEMQENYILVKVKDKYYEMYSSTEFSNLLLFDEWEILNEITSDNEIVISLQLAELWVVDIYENGVVAAYDGYAPQKYHSSAYYTTPIMKIENIIKFLEENAIPHKMGDGTISSSTFRHE